MGSRMTVALFGLAGIVVGLALLVTLHVSTSSRYSMAYVPSDPASKELTQKWDALESDFHARIDHPDTTRLRRDPMWPTYVSRPRASVAAVPAPKTESPRLSTPERQLALAAPPPPLLPPRLMALLLDRDARAMLQHEGRSRLVRPGDRFGNVHVVDVGPDGVTIEWNGTRKLLRLP